MSDKFQNKYRIPSARAPWWDYGHNGAYFITICTRNREHYFGEIVNDEMQLSPLGKIAGQCYLEMPEHFPFTVLDEFVVMPNHVHAIIVIDKPELKNEIGNGVATEDASVETRLIASLRSEPQTAIPSSNTIGGFAGNKNPMLNENLSRVLRWYKGRATFECKKIHADFGWQSRFHDHIIRNEESYQTIKNYIRTNPQNWDNDKFKN